MVSDCVSLRREDGIAVLTLNRPERFNSVSMALLDDLERHLDAVEAEPALRAVLIAGAGKHFCTGADLDEVSERRRSRQELAAFIVRGHEVLRRLEGSPLPVLAAVQGYCLAGGMELMMAADWVMAAEDARIGCQHARFGLVPGWGGTQRLPRLVGLRRALELMYSARWLAAAEALDWGLINAVVAPEHLQEAALETARSLTQRNPQGLAAMKRLARVGCEGSLADGLALEREHVVDALLSENVSEGLAAFRERREPRFR